MNSSLRTQTTALGPRARGGPPATWHELAATAFGLLFLMLMAGCASSNLPTPTIETDQAQPTEFSLPKPTEPPTAAPTPTAIRPPRLGKIVYVCQPSGDMRFDQLCLIHPDGSEQQQLTTEPMKDHFYPSLSPDGESVVFSANLDGPDEIYEMPLTGVPRRLTYQDNAYAPAISPNGSQIVYTQIDGSVSSVWLMNRDGSDAHQLVSQAWDPVWSPGGEWILHASDRGGSVQLWRISALGGQPEQLTSMANLRGRSDWSPDGTWLATYAGEPWHREIVRIRLADGSVQRLTDGGNNLAPSFSPDGGWIAFTSYRDKLRDENGCEIYVMHLESRTIFRLTDNDTCDWQPRWGN
ncbi:MAG: hypothetical protein WBR18_05710 [Anaerolineales bacterium]